jgi:hypothetical protein
MLIREIHDMVSGVISNDDSGIGPMPRWKPDERSRAGEILRFVSDSDEPTSLSDANSQFPFSKRVVREQLTSMYRSYILDKVKDDPHEYVVSGVGESLVSEWDKQRRLPTEGESSSNTNPDPWDNTELNRSQYIALQCIADFGGHPKSSDINQHYCDRMGKESRGEPQYRISSRLTALYRKDLVNRPPKTPYQYWLTERGKELIEK